MQAGLVLGPTLLGEGSELKAMLFPNGTSVQEFETLAMLGIMMFMFLLGVKTDMSLLSRARKMEVTISMSAVITPFIINFGSMRLFRQQQLRHHHDHKQEEYYISSRAMDVFPTQVAAIVQHLSELRMLSSKLGRLVVFIAVVAQICDVLFMLFNETKSPKTGLILLLFLIFLFCVIRPLML